MLHVRYTYGDRWNLLSVFYFNFIHISACLLNILQYHQELYGEYSAVVDIGWELNDRWTIEMEKLEQCFQACTF